MISNSHDERKFNYNLSFYLYDFIRQHMISKIQVDLKVCRKKNNNSINYESGKTKNIQRERDYKQSIHNNTNNIHCY